ncbi:MAG: tyrosine-type recombinase/integrase [Myxococcota bacterium]
MAKRDPSRPSPVSLEVGGRTLATAYARRPPGNRKGTEHWAWVVHLTDSKTGKPVQRALGRVPSALVGTRLAEFYRGINPAAITSDGSGVSGVGELLRAYFAHLEGRQETDDALAPRTVRFYEGSAKRLMPAVEHAPLVDMNEAWVMAVRAQLLGDFAVRTVKADLKFLRQAIVWGRRQGLDVPDLSVRAAQTFKGRKAKAHVNNHRTPTEEEVGRLYQSMRRSGTKLAMYIMWQTGCRVGEAGALWWRDIQRDADGHWVHFREGKTGPRITPITAEAYAELLSYRPEDAGEDAGLFRKPSQVSANTGAAIAVACQARGRNIEPFTSHGLRRLFTDRCIRARVDIATYADIAGHSIETALKHYRTVTVDDRIAALHRLNSGSDVDLLAWVARHGVSEAEAVRVLEGWVDTGE